MAQNEEKIKVSDTIYVGIQSDKAFKPGDAPLGFMTYFDQDDAKFKARKDTAERWCNHYDRSIKTHVKGYADFIDNEPASGFKIVDFATRWSTSNKVFEVVDPRGFKLQISADNLVYLLINTKIVYGEIMEPCVWGRDPNPFLIPEKSKRIRASVPQVEKKLKDLVYGDVVETAQSGKIMYLGKKWVKGVKAIEVRTQPAGYRPNYSYGPPDVEDHTFVDVDLDVRHVFWAVSSPGEDTHVYDPSPDDKSYAKSITFPRAPELHICKTVKIVEFHGNGLNKYNLPNSDKFFLLSNAIADLGWRNYRVMYFDTKEAYEKYNTAPMVNYMKPFLDKVIESDKETLAWRGHQAAWSKAKRDLLNKRQDTTEHDKLLKSKPDSYRFY